MGKGGGGGGGGGGVAEPGRQQIVQAPVGVKMNYKNKLCSQDFHLDALPLLAGSMISLRSSGWLYLRCFLGSVTARASWASE